MRARPCRHRTWGKSSESEAAISTAVIGRVSRGALRGLLAEAAIQASVEEDGDPGAFYLALLARPEASQSKEWWLAAMTPLLESADKGDVAVVEVLRGIASWVARLVQERRAHHDWAGSVLGERELDRFVRPTDSTALALTMLCDLSRGWALCGKTVGLLGPHLPRSEHTAIQEVGDQIEALRQMFQGLAGASNASLTAAEDRATQALRELISRLG